MANLVTLKTFTSSELIFDTDETKAILKFFFKSQHNLINTLNVTDNIRSFAQALLIEAIDATYAMGFVEAIFKSSSNPGAGIKKLLKKFTKKATEHWFKHASEKDLLNIEVYEIIRSRISLNFGRYLIMLASGLASNKTAFSANLSYA